VKWTRSSVVVVGVVLAVSYGYSGIREMQLSNKVEEDRQKACVQGGGHDCGLISKYHDECFNASYRAEYRIKSFHRDEYNDCMARRISQGSE